MGPRRLRGRHAEEGPSGHLSTIHRPEGAKAVAGVRVAWSATGLGALFSEDSDRRRRARHAPDGRDRGPAPGPRGRSRPRTAATAGGAFEARAARGRDHRLGDARDRRHRADRGASASIEGGGYTYIMVLTARADEDASREAVRAGADDVLAKPPDPAELERGLIAAERLVTMHRRMTSDARRDPLTGAGSRLRLDEDLAALCARVDALRARLLRGDDRPRSPAATTRSAASGAALAHEIRSGDVLYRYGPAQFVVLLPEQGLDTANLAADRLRAAAEQRGVRRARRSASGSSPRAPSRSRRRCWRRPRRRWRSAAQSGRDRRAGRRGGHRAAAARGRRRPGRRG